jgi:hypothetical protein
LVGTGGRGGSLDASIFMLLVEGSSKQYIKHKYIHNQNNLLNHCHHHYYMMEDKLGHLGDKNTTIAHWQTHQEEEKGELNYKE